MRPYLSEKARGEIPRVLKWLRGPRPITLRRKGSGQWFLWEQALMTGIRAPASADPWA